MPHNDPTNGRDSSHKALDTWESGDHNCATDSEISSAIRQLLILSKGVLIQMSETTQVQMEDGSVVEFTEKMKVKKQSFIDSNSGDLVTKFVFRNGAVRTHVTAADDAMVARLALHGADQKFGDEFAGLDDVEDCIQAFEEMSARIARGEWSEKRSSDGLAGTSLLARALVAVTGKTIEEVKTRLGALDAKTKAAMAKQPKIAQAIAEIKAARDAKKPAKDGIDPNEALNSFLS